MRLFIIIVCVVFSQVVALSDFELIPRGSRSLAMGGTGVANSNDAYSAFHNPASLCRINGIDASIEYSPMWNLGDHMGSMGAILPFADGLSLSAAYSRLQVNGIPVYEVLDGSTFEERIIDQSIRSTGISSGELNSAMDIIIMSMARWFNLSATTGEFSRLSIPLSLSLGASIKFQRQSFYVAGNSSVPDYVGLATDIDGGMLVVLDLDRDMKNGKATRSFSSGVVFKNILASDMKYNSDRNYADKGERIRSLGFSLMQCIEKINGGVEASLEFIKSDDKKLERFGAEILFLEKWRVRGGYMEGNPTIGFGLTHKQLRIDWAYMQHDLSSQPYKISLSYNVK